MLCEKPKKKHKKNTKTQHENMRKREDENTRRRLMNQANQSVNKNP